MPKSIETDQLKTKIAELKSDFELLSAFCSQCEDALAKFETFIANKFVDPSVKVCTITREEIRSLPGFDDA